MPSRLRGGRLGASRSAVLAVLAIVAIVVLVAGARLAWAVQGSQPRSIPDPPPLTALEPALSSPSATTQATPTELIVHVAGAVGRPGIVRLRPGDRVVDAVDAAGGASDQADLSAINLARSVVDGEQVYVPLPGEVPPAPPPASGGGDVGAAGGAGGSGGTIDLNTADQAALESLPGVGPVLAGRILEWRGEHGRFTSVDELGEVSGIGEKMLAQLRDRVRIGP